jgi:hypothetical protein
VLAGIKLLRELNVEVQQILVEAWSDALLPEVDREGVGLRRVRLQFMLSP